VTLDEFKASLRDGKPPQVYFSPARPS